MDTIKGFNLRELRFAVSPERFHLILFPTEQCNFRCVYCYEDFNVGKMPDWVVTAVKTLLAKKIPKLRILELSWFGGEPLLAKDIMFDLAQYAYDLAQQYECVIMGDVTTNGSLLDLRTFTRLVKLKQNRFQISIDGAQEVHDQTRLTRNGRGSFAMIWRRLMDAAATDLDFRITLRIHLTSQNRVSVEEFCQLYYQNLEKDPRFSLYFKAIENLGGDNQAEIQKLSGAGSLRKIAALLQEAHDPKPAADNYICYAAKPNSLAIRANGSLNKCTVALQDEKNQIGKILPDGTLEIRQQKFSTWIQGFSRLDSWSMGCPHSYLDAQKPQKTYSNDIAIVQVV